MDWYDGYNHMGNGGWVVMTLMMGGFWAAVVLLSLFLFRQTAGAKSPGQPAQHDPQSILDDRFARGEVDQEEYLSRKKALRMRV